jgi:hypothetical protein
LIGGGSHVHIVGIGGAGMSAIATVLAAMGHRVTGSDLVGSPVTDRLGTQGIAVALGHRADQVAGADLVTASPAVSAENVELAEAHRLGIPVLARSEVMAAIARLKRCVAVAGTHGKTTTSSMLALALGAARLKPSFLIGADVGDLDTNGVFDEGPWMVVEADESYGTFAALTPEMTVLTSVEADHLDHYGTLAALAEAFAHLLEATTGTCLVAADDPGAAAIGAAAGALAVGESDGAAYRVRDLVLGRSRLRFELDGPAAGSRCRCRAATTPPTPRWRRPPPSRSGRSSGPSRPRWPASPASRGASNSAARPAASPSSTTTGTSRARSRRCSLRRVSAGSLGWWRCSSRTATPARPRWRVTSHTRSVTPTWSW